jgi:hypothetical protein
MPEALGPDSLCNRRGMTDEATPLSCEQCKDFLDRPSSGSFAMGQCQKCGRTRNRIPGPVGLVVDEGETVTVQLPPLTMVPGGSHRLSRPGLSWFVRQMVFADGDPTTPVELVDKIGKEVADANSFLESSERIAEFISDPEKYGDELDSMMSQDSWPEKWAALYVNTGSELIDEENLLDAAGRQVVLWRLAKVRTMLMFTRHLEELAWRGYRNFGADALAEVLTAWDDSDEGELEEYWQTFLQDRPFLMSLISPGPLAVHTGKAFLGGKKVDNTGGKVVDFLLAHSIGGNAALLEIKRPTTQLLARTAYRSDIYAPSPELSGSVSQILNYRDTLMTEYTRNVSPLQVFMPSCMVLIGNYGNELDSPEKTRSFELFRSSLNGVSIVTFDELFARLKKILDVLRGD